MWEITDFCFNLRQKHEKFINIILLIGCIINCTLCVMGFHINFYFFLFYIPINTINFFSIRRKVKYGYKPILRMSEEEIILNELIGENDWEKIAYDYILPEDFISKYKEHLNWYSIVSYQKLRIQFIEEM